MMSIHSLLRGMSARWLASAQKMNIENAQRKKPVKPVVNQSDLGASSKAKSLLASFRLRSP
jgi:hypothetical protein